MNTRYLDLSIGAPARLAILRRDAAAWNAKHPHAPMQSPDWRRMRFAKLTYPRGLSQGSQGEGRDYVQVWYTHDGEAFRKELFADESSEAPRSIANNRGYYTDTDAREVARPIVAYVGRGIWLAGYEWSSNGERVWFADKHDSEREACFAADSHAEHFAENEREQRERTDAARQLQDQVEAKQQRMRECLALRNDPRPCFAAMREEVRECIDAIRTARATLAADYSDVEI